MIPVAPIAGGTILLNADLIEAIESDPDTVIVLANGRRMVVTDDPHTLVQHISRARAAVLAAAQDIVPRGNAKVVPLRPAKGQS